MNKASFEISPDCLHDRDRSGRRSCRWTSIEGLATTSDLYPQIYDFPKFMLEFVWWFNLQRSTPIWAIYNNPVGKWLILTRAFKTEQKQTSQTVRQQTILLKYLQKSKIFIQTINIFASDFSAFKFSIFTSDMLIFPSVSTSYIPIIFFLNSLNSASLVNWEKL